MERGEIEKDEINKRLKISIFISLLTECEIDDNSGKNKN